MRKILTLILICLSPFLGYGQEHDDYEEEKEPQEVYGWACGRIGRTQPERIKIEVGAAMTEIDNPPDDYPVHGRDMLTGIPKEVKVEEGEIKVQIVDQVEGYKAMIRKQKEDDKKGNSDTSSEPTKKA